MLFLHKLCLYSSNSALHVMPSANVNIQFGTGGIVVLLFSSQEFEILLLVDNS